MTSTYVNLSSSHRIAAAELIAERYLESMSTRDLEEYFLHSQLECLLEYTDEELLGAVEDVTTEEEFAEFTKAK